MKHRAETGSMLCMYKYPIYKKYILLTNKLHFKYMYLRIQWMLHSNKCMFKCTFNILQVLEQRQAFNITEGL